MKIVLLVITLLSVNCYSERRLIFFDDFNQSNDLISLFDPGRFTHFEKTLDANIIKIMPSGDGFSAGFYAESNSVVSKASLEVEGFSFEEGQTILMSALVYVKDSDINGLFLFDLECIVCWPTNLPPEDNKHIGIRLMILDGYLAVERGKIGYRDGTLTDQTIPFPTEEWVTLSWLVQLSPDNGYTEAYIDDQIVLSRYGENMLSGPSVPYVRYDKFEFGITANGSSSNIIAYFDDISVYVVE